MEMRVGPAASLSPSGVSTPWLIALFRKNTLAGSMMMLVNGSRWLSTRKWTPADRMFMMPLTIQASG